MKRSLYWDIVFHNHGSGVCSPGKANVMHVTGHLIIVVVVLNCPNLLHCHLQPVKCLLSLPLCSWKMPFKRLRMTSNLAVLFPR